MNHITTAVKEIHDEFNKKIDSENYPQNSHDLIEPNDSILMRYWYPESMYELDEDKVRVFLSSATIKVLESVVEEIEENFGKRGGMSGSMGYQGIVANIQAYQTQEDKQKDDIIKSILSAIDLIKKEQI